MRVGVRLFGALAERAGTGQLEVDLPEGATAQSLRALVGERWPAVADLLPRVTVAVNQEVVRGDHPIRPDDEVALLPPVAGGAAAVLTGLRAPPLPLDEALEAVAHPAAGAIVTFLGTVRDHSDGMDEVHELAYSAYEEMAERVLGDIAGETVARWPQLTGVVVLHALGDLAVGTHTILVVCSAPHREEAFAACRHALEETKRRVPVFKHERGASGARWVGAESGPEEAHW